jgi:hypothetical protein
MANQEMPKDALDKHPFTPYTHYTIYMVQKCSSRVPDDGGPPVFCKVFEEKVLVSRRERRWKHKLLDLVSQLKQEAYFSLWLRERYWHTNYTIDVEACSSIEDFLSRHPEYKSLIDKKYLQQP